MRVLSSSSYHLWFPSCIAKPPKIVPSPPFRFRFGTQIPNPNPKRGAHFPFPRILHPRLIFPAHLALEIDGAGDGSTRLVL